jgi:uncharacterized protein
MPTPANAIFALGLIALMGAVSYFTLRSGQILRTWTPPFNLMLTVADNVARLVLVLLCIVLGVTAGPGPAALGWQTAHVGLDLAVGLIAGLLLALMLNWSGRLAVRTWGPAVASTRMLQCIMPADRLEWAGVLIALLPAAALEELLFRSLPLGGLGWWLSPWWLLWPLALLFGLLHWPQGAWGVAGTTLAAVCLGLLFLITGSIWVVLAAHYAMNVHQLLAAKRSGLLPLRATS